MASQEEDEQPSNLRSGFLERIELENFKSYGGSVVIGPFKGFNAVIGTNGSGKSNLMDAISFVLGVKTTQLRGNQLRDLVYRNMSDKDDYPASRKASVKLFYRKAEGQMVTFSRAVTLSGASEYRVNGKQMSLDKYNKELAKIGILVKARNCLVFQNEVESIASKSPKELTAMFEEVSGSAEYRDAFNEAFAEKESAQDEVTVHWQKRKGMAAEKRQFKQQKEEAEKYRQLKREIGTIKTHQIMFRLYHLDKEIKVCKREASQAEEEHAEKERIQEEIMQSLVETTKAVEVLDKKRMTQERKLNRIQDEIDKFRPMEVKLKAEQSGIQRRLKGEQRNLDNAKENATNRSTVVESLTEELREVEGKVEEVKKEIADAERSNFSEQDMTEYWNLKETAATRTSDLEQAASIAGRSKASAGKQKETSEWRLSEMKSRHRNARNEGATFRNRAQDLARKAQETRKELHKVTVEKKRLEEAGGDRDRARAELERTVQQTTQALRDAKADQHENVREKAFNAALESMKRLFPGVLGRLSDLCKPTQPRYREAVAVVLGSKLMNAIVVDNERTGSDCIAYMKDQRAGIATFLPLDTIRPRPVDEALRRLGGTARLVIDVLDYKDSIAKAVQYAAANAVVCDTLAEARRIRYDDKRKVKICSLDGTVINKAGFMTGGTSRSSKDKAAQWDRNEIEGLKKRRAQAQEELNQMGPAISDRRQIANLAERIDRLNQQAGILDVDGADVDSRANNHEIEAQRCEDDLGVLEEQVKNATVAYDKVKVEFDAIQEKLHGLENELFGDFAQRHGVSSVQEFEARAFKRAEELREKLLGLETKQSEISSRLKYEQTGKPQDTVARIEGKIKNYEEQMSKAQTNLDQLYANRAELVSRYEKLQETITKTSEEREDKYSSLKEKRKEHRRGKEVNAQLQTSLGKQNSSLQLLQSKRATVLSEARVQQIQVYMAKKGAPKFKRKFKKKTKKKSSPQRKSRRRQHESDDDDDEDDDEDESDEEEDEEQDEMEVDEEDEDMMEIDTNNETMEETQDPTAAVNQVVVDYSRLPSELKASANENADTRSEKLAELSERLSSIEAQLETMAPNMRAKEHMDEVAAKIAAVEEEASKARQRSATAIQKYHDIESKRNRAFSDCFSHVQGKIEEVYKQLTLSSTYTMGGNAYLSLEKQHQPYLGGIKYNVMPPSKRLRDMDQLSGGERTVAALALLFAIHDYRPSPFFVLDEIDAALDKLNVGRVSNYIRRRAPELQTIVISLKDAFFEKADALIGIYRDVDLNASRLLTLDLSQYNEVESGEPEAEAAA